MTTAAPSRSPETTLVVRDLSVWLGRERAVRDLSVTIRPGLRLGIVGESGAGKSMTALALAGLLPDGAQASGSVEMYGQNLIELSERRIAALRGRHIGFVFQDALAALNPVVRVGAQVEEVYRRNRGMRRAAARTAALEMLDRVGLPNVTAKARAYPHELSGGQRQRVMIAIAMACSPELLIADEPTTALDVTVQAEILDLMNRLVTEEHAALLFISHDLPVVSALCEEVCVMYGGRIVESGPTDEIFRNPRHPYTAGLLAAQPSELQVDGEKRRLATIPGVVPPLGAFPKGCEFRDRCNKASRECKNEPSTAEDGRRTYRCWHPLSGNPERPAR